METVSIIIPCRNGSLTIAKAVESILGQTVPTEAIVVLDGEDAGSEKVLARYKERISLIKAEKAGPDNARRIGAEAANGSIIGFLDADDLLSCDVVEKVLDKFASTDADVVGISTKEVLSVCGLPLICKTLPNSQMENAVKSLLCGTDDFHPAMWNKYYRREALLPWPQTGYNGFWGEDRLTNLHIFSRNLRMEFAPEAVITHYIYKRSCNPWSEGREAEYIEVARLKREFAVKHELQQFIPAIDAELEELLSYNKARKRPSIGNMARRLLLRLT